MVTGLTAAGVVTPPIILPLVLVAANLGVFMAARGLVLGVILSLVLIVLTVMSTQVFSAGITAVGRDAIFLLIGALGFGVFFLQQRVAMATGELGLGPAALAHPLSGVSWLIPPVAAQNAIAQDDLRKLRSRGVLR